MLVVEPDVLVAGLVLLFAADFLFEEQTFKLAEGRTFRLIKPQENGEKLAIVCRIELLDDFQIFPNQLFSVDLQCLRVEARDFVHQSELNEHQPCAENI